MNSVISAGEGPAPVTKENRWCLQDIVGFFKASHLGFQCFDLDEFFTAWSGHRDRLGLGGPGGAGFLCRRWALAPCQRTRPRPICNDLGVPWRSPLRGSWLRGCTTWACYPSSQKNTAWNPGRFSWEYLPVGWSYFHESAWLQGEIRLLIGLRSLLSDPKEFGEARPAPV
jgi:hypothetical protein